MVSKKLLHLSITSTKEGKAGKSASLVLALLPISKMPID